MKAVLTLVLTLAAAAPLLAQNYQPQYPYDPYSSAPRPQPNSYATTSSAPTPSSEYDKLLSYGSLSLDYSFLDFKNSSIFNGSNGLAAQLRVPLFRPLFLDVGVDWHSGTDTKNRNFSFTGVSAAAGLFLPIGSRFHIFGELGGKYENTSGSLSVLHLSDFSIFLRPGVRVAVSDSFEVAGSVYFGNTNNLNDRVLELNGYYAMLSVLDLGFGVDFGSDSNTYHAGLRLRW